MKGSVMGGAGSWEWSTTDASERPWRLRRFLITLAFSAATGLAGWLLVERGLGTLNKEDVWGGVIACTLMPLFSSQLGRMMLLPLWWTMSCGLLNGSGSDRATGPYMSLFVCVTLGAYAWMTYRTVTEIDRHRKVYERVTSPYPLHMLLDRHYAEPGRGLDKPARANGRILRGNMLATISFLLFNAAGSTPWFDTPLCLTMLFLLSPSTFPIAWVIWYWVAGNARDAAALSWVWPALAATLFAWGFYNFKRVVASFREADGRTHWEVKRDHWAESHQSAAQSMRESAYRIEQAERRITQARRRP